MSAPDKKRPRLDGPEDVAENIDDGETEREEKMNVVLALCGSFNPITFLHLRLFELARDWLHKTGKYTVMAGLISPVHIAYGKKGLLSNEHRLAMSRAAVKDSSWISVDDWECSQDQWTVTNKVLKQLQENARNMFPADNVQLKFLCGGDLLESFATPGLWSSEDIREIICNYGLVVVSRYGSNPEKFVYESDELYSLKEHIQIVTEWIPNDVSSTKIRRSLRRGESVRYLIPDPVVEYITQHNLYQESPSP